MTAFKTINAKEHLLFSVVRIISAFTCVECTVYIARYLNALVLWCWDFCARDCWEIFVLVPPPLYDCCMLTFCWYRDSLCSGVFIFSCNSKDVRCKCLLDVNIGAACLPVFSCQCLHVVYVWCEINNITSASCRQSAVLLCWLPYWCFEFVIGLIMVKK